MQGREQEALQRAVWEAEHPEEEAKQKAELEANLGALKAISGTTPEYEQRQKRIAEIKRQGDRCAECGKPFGPRDVIYRRGGIASPVLPYCQEHACGLMDGHHNKDAPEGSYYPACRCLDDEQGARRWLKPEPCAGCGRLVANDRESADPCRFMREWETASEAQERRRMFAECKTNDERLELARELGPSRRMAARTFCSESCRRRTVACEAKAKRQAARGDLTRRCEGCHERFTPQRVDARYCSPACRQRAYRKRHKEAAA
jgi:hypothetical protein